MDQLTGSLGLLHADYVCLQTVQKSPQAPPRALQRGTQAIHIPGYHLHAFVVGGPSCLDYGLYGGGILAARAKFKKRLNHTEGVLLIVEVLSR